jgi:hypothetical protein
MVKYDIWGICVAMALTEEGKKHVAFQAEDGSAILSTAAFVRAMRGPPTNGGHHVA